jgi:hypothetical protein
MYNPQPYPRQPGMRPVTIVLIVCASVLGALLILGGAAYIIHTVNRNSGPGFACSVTAGGTDSAWNTQVTVTGPTPATGIIQVNVVYFNGSRQETGSLNDMPLAGFTGISVPAGQSVTYTLQDAENETGPVPASCQVTGYT